MIEVVAINSTGEIATVYNLRVADHHTYFVGGAIWGWDVWVHNTYGGAVSTVDDALTSVTVRSSDELISQFDTIASAPSRAVIGKIKDLDNLAPNEHTLLKHLPDQGSPRANWAQNSSVLRQEIRKGRPIRDASLNPDGTLKTYPGSFLEAERNLLRNKEWWFDHSSGLWMPPS